MYVISIVLLAVKPVNSSVSQVIQGARAISIEFDETIFDATSVRVNFSSNCTSSVTVGYSNPLMVTIPDTGLNTGQCQYNIQLVDNNSQQIGYPVLGFFVAEGIVKVFGCFVAIHDSHVINSYKSNFS